jgi:hypothetical protein
MENPWHDLINSKDKSNLILENEKEIIRKFNDKNRELGPDNFYNYHIHTEILPAPFMGDVHNSPIVLLTLNPGWDEKELEKDFYNLYSNYWESMMKHEFILPDLPLFCLEDEYTAISPYWNSKLQHLISRTSKEAVAKNVSVIQFFPYQSKKYKALYKGLSADYLDSQKYNFKLVRQAIDRKALIIILRSRRIWIEAVKELESYPNVRYTRSVLNPVLSENNLGDSFFEIIERIKKNSL